MITVKEAKSILDRHPRDFGIETIELDRALDRVIREPLIADRPMPPYNRVTMDGIAIAYKSYSEGQREYLIEKVAAAGDTQQQLEHENHCIEIMTGAILPMGVDTVIRYEDLEIKDGMAHLLQPVKERRNIHFRGEDRQAGELLVAEGTVLSPAEIGVAASIGKAKVAVSKLPRVALIATGNELVEIDEQPEPHQIRKSNVYRIAATLKSFQIIPTLFHFRDDVQELEQALGDILARYDVVLLSGGVSKGKFDFLPEVLTSLGVQKHFHGITQRPGKPFWFGSMSGGPVVFAFPGNPISSFLCTQVYFLPWLRQSLGFPALSVPTAALTEEVEFLPDLTFFLEVKLAFTEDGRLLAHPHKGHGSGDLANLIRADAFMMLPQGQDVFAKGAVYEVIPYRNFIAY